MIKVFRSISPLVHVAEYWSVGWLACDQALIKSAAGRVFPPAGRLETSQGQVGPLQTPVAGSSCSRPHTFRRAKIRSCWSANILDLLRGCLWIYIPNLTISENCTAWLVLNLADYFNYFPLWCFFVFVSPKHNVVPRVTDLSAAYLVNITGALADNVRLLALNYIDIERMTDWSEK